MSPSLVSSARFLPVFVFGFFSTARAVVIDGSIAQDDYGDPVAVQTVNTGFGDNFSELNAAYGKIAGGVLYLVLTGNLENNFNKLEIFIDAVPGGQNVIDGESNANTDNWAALFEGFRFDDGFAPDYLFIFRHGNAGGQVLDLDFVSIGANEGGSIGRFQWQNPPSNGPFEASNGVLLGFNNSNAGGVGGGESEADPDLARAVQTGLELAIPLSIIGSPEGDVRICAMINGSNHDFLSNQLLGGLSAPQGNLGTNGQGGFVAGSTLTVDLNTFAGDQFFIVPQDPGAAVPAAVTRVEAAVQSLTIEFTDSETTAVDPESIELRVDDALVSFLLEQDLPRTLVTYVPDPPFAAGSSHAYAITAADDNGQPVGRTGEFTLPESLLPTGSLPGPEGSAGQWSLRQIWDFEQLVDGGLDGLSEALAVANAADAPGFPGSFSDAVVPYLNFRSGGIFFNSLGYPAQEDPVLGMPEDNYVIVAKGFLRIPASGDWTLGVHSDDGFALRVVGAVFDSVHGAGQLDPIDRSVMGHPGNTADSDTRGILLGLGAGDYPVEIITWDASGGDFFEFYAAPGAHTTDASSDQWALPGDIEGPAEVLVPGVSAEGWTVKASPPGGDPVESLSVAETVLAGVFETKEYDAVNFKDPDDGSAAAGILPGDLPFPNDTPDNDNHFAVEATAMLVIPETATYWIGFQGDDGAKLQIEGQNFEEIIADATGTAFGVGTDTLTCDCLTGNSRTLGRITLAEGDYPIRVVMFEAAFGSYLEVFGAEEGSPRLFPIARNGAGTRAVNRGLSLSRPGGDIRIVDFQRAPSGGPAVLRWTSTPSSLFEVQASVEGRPDTWTALVSGYPEGGATEAETSYTDTDPEGPLRIYRVGLLPPVPVFTEDFETGAEGWLTGAKPGDGGSTVWELGSPASGPSTAHSGSNVYGTNLGGPYGNASRIFLHSPLIDLRDRVRATLEFWHFLDADPVEGGQVNLLAEDGSLLRAQLLIFTGESSTTDWRKAVLRLPEEALGQQVRIEFEFLSDDTEPNGDGWYLDDVLVTE